MWLFSWVHWGLAFGGPTQPLPGVFPAGELPLPMWPEEPWTPLCSWGFTLPTRTLPGTELQHFRLCAPPVYTVLNEFKPPPFSFLPLLFSPLHTLSFLSSCVRTGGCFLYSPPISILSSQAKTASCPLQLSPPVHLSTPHTCQVLWVKLCKLLC